MMFDIPLAQKFKILKYFNILYFQTPLFNQCKLALFYALILLLRGIPTTTSSLLITSSEYPQSITSFFKEEGKAHSELF